MARWKLTATHYLNVPGTEWEYEETTRATGKRFRKRFEVPLYLSTEDAEYQNRDGEVIVAWAGSAIGTDVIFVGNPTPDMEPRDAEAEAISERLRPTWVHAIESLPSTGDFSQSLLTMFEKQIEALGGLQASPAANISGKGVDPAEFAALQEQVKALILRNAELEAKDEPTATARRV